MGKQRLSLGSVTDSAITLIDREGFEALSLSAVAHVLGVGPSALYAHVDGLQGLKYLVAIASTENLTAEVRNAAIGTSGDDALGAMGAAYRSFAHSKPGQFASTLVPPRTADDDLAAANRSLLDVFVLVYRAMGLEAEAAAQAASSTRSAIHGFLALEHAAGSTSALTADYEHLLGVLQRGMLADRGADARHSRD